MSDLIREQASWRRGKTPVLIKYMDDHAKLFAEIAGRGFSFLPGYAYDVENQLELAAKMGLSELNLKILTETVEREIKQSGFNYDQSYKAAAIAWELEKQGLLNAWAAEYAGIKLVESEEEGALNLLAIEVAKRAITLMESKTAIEVSMEGYRKELADLESSAAPYEVQLANAKLLTAQKKLELIPVVQEIIAKEQELIATKQSKASEYSLYVAKEQALGSKKEELLPFINDLANKAEEYAGLIESKEIPLSEQISDEKILQSESAIITAGYRSDEITNDIETAEKAIDVMAAKRDVQKTQFDYDQEIISQNITYDEDYQDQQLGSFHAILNLKREASARIISDREQIHTQQSDARTSSATTITSAEIAQDGTIATMENSRDTQVAEYNAAAVITAALKHLIG